MLVSGLALGVVAGFAIGRNWEPLSRTTFRMVPVLVGALALRAVAPLFGELGFGFYVAALSGTAVAAVANRGLTGAWLVAAGASLNLLVVLLNGGMPFDPTAVAAAGARVPVDSLHVPLVETSKLGVLADVIPVALVSNVYSVGDFLIAAGGFLVPFKLLSRK
jgi:hypothetical protein